MRNGDGNVIFKIIESFVSGAKVLPKMKKHLLVCFVNSIFIVLIWFMNFGIFAVVGAWKENLDLD